MTTKKKISKQLKNKDGKKKNKKKYKIRNWHEYNESLVQRGALDVWIEETVLKNWEAPHNNKRGAQPVYSDLAIALVLQFGKVFHQKLRQTEGLVKSIFNLMRLALNVPDFTTLSRRSANVSVKLPKSNKEKIIVIADSSGLKVYGEGEWKVRKHGWSKHRTWRKIHLLITPYGEIRAGKLTENNVADGEAVEDLLGQEEAKIEGFAGDGAYDKSNVYDLRQNREIEKIMVPP